MTGIVIATVIIFAALVGGADYMLSLGVKQAVTTQAASATPSVGRRPQPPRSQRAATDRSRPNTAPTVSP